MRRLDVVDVLTCGRSTNLRVANLTDDVVCTGNYFLGCKYNGRVGRTGVARVLEVLAIVDGRCEFNLVEKSLLISRNLAAPCRNEFQGAEVEILCCCLCEVNLVCSHVSEVAWQTLAEDKILNGVETCKVLTCSDSLVDGVCFVLKSLLAKFCVLIEAHVFVKLSAVEWPCVCVRVDSIVAGSSEEESLRELPPFT